MKPILLVMVLFVGACSEPLEVELLSYQGCRKQMTKEYIDEGADPVAANMKAKAYCEERMGK